MLVPAREDHIILLCVFGAVQLLDNIVCYRGAIQCGKAAQLNFH